MKRLVMIAALAGATAASAADYYNPPVPPYAQRPPAPIPSNNGPPCAPARVGGTGIWPDVEVVAVRVGPGEEFPLVTTLPKGYPLLVCGRTGDWFTVLDPICMQGGPCVHGWAYSRWVLRA